MRRLLCAALLVASSIGIIAIPAVADSGNGTVLLSFDYSDNSAPPSVSNGPFNVIVDVLPGDTAGLIRMFAVAPAEHQRLEHRVPLPMD